MPGPGIGRYPPAGVRFAGHFNGPVPGAAPNRPSDAIFLRTEPNRTEPNRVEPGRAGPHRAGPGPGTGVRTKTKGPDATHPSPSTSSHSANDDRQDVASREHEELVGAELDLGAAVLAVQDAVTDGDVERNAVA